MKFAVDWIEELKQWCAKEIHSDGTVFSAYGFSPMESMVNLGNKYGEFKNTDKPLEGQMSLFSNEPYKTANNSN